MPISCGGSLGALGISVRRFPGRDVEGWLRITLPGDDENFERLPRGLRTVCAPDALLFDMDGVLADVSGSYRRAIIETAATWDVELTPEDVARAKADGDATNDWESDPPPACRARGRGRSRRGDRAIRGSLPGNRRGARSASFRVPEVRTRIARKALGRVSRLPWSRGGRDRTPSDFWRNRALPIFFQPWCAWRTGPSKPDPAPVRLALERLGAATAWMVGDTPDDMRAARSAGVLPIGLPAVGDDPVSMQAALAAAGAAKVIDKPNDFEELLP